MRKLLFFVSTLCLSILLVMCTTENETPTISIDKQSVSEVKPFDSNDIENWVQTNYKVLATYNRKEIATYPRTVQRAILRSFSPEKRKEIWQSKVEYLTSSSNFSKDEKHYLQWFAEKFNELSYDKAFEKDISQEMYDRAIAGIDKFGWSKTQVHKMFFTIGNLSNVEEQAERNPDPDPIGTYCECYYDLGCPTWNCDSNNGCNDSGSNPNDCGVFGGTTCDGNC